MKIVKLNRRFKQYKEHGHTVALRFNGWSQKSQVIENLCKDRLGSHGWLPQSDWHHYFGDRPRRDAPRPYWITFRNEADLTMIMLSATLS